MPVIDDEMKMPFRIMAPSFLPYAMDMKVPVPSERPMIIDVRKVISV